MTLALPDVTLCAITAINHELTIRAMNECLKHCSFSDVVLISDKPIEAPFRVEVIPTFSGLHFYAPFVCKHLHEYTASSFNLIVQFDGYIVNPLAWSDEFLKYDYIGAKWPWFPENRRVGNSGFCLRSKKLLNILAEQPLPPYGTYVDDTFICHSIRDHLEIEHNIKIAPDLIADRFSYEREKPPHSTFGFHGMFNSWRHIDDVEMEKVIRLLDEYYVKTRAYSELVFQYYTIRKYHLVAVLYSRMRELMGAASVRQHLLNLANDPEYIDRIIETAS